MKTPTCLVLGFNVLDWAADVLTNQLEHSVFNVQGTKYKVLRFRVKSTASLPMQSKSVDHQGAESKSSDHGA